MKLNELYKEHPDTEEEETLPVEERTRSAPEERLHALFGAPPHPQAVIRRGRETPPIWSTISVDEALTITYSSDDTTDTSRG